MVSFADDVDMVKIVAWLLCSSLARWEIADLLH